MLRNEDKWRKFEVEFAKSTALDAARNLRIMDELYKHARALGVFPPEDSFEGLDDTIRLVKALHVSTTFVPDRPRA